MLGRVIENEQELRGSKERRPVKTSFKGVILVDNGIIHIRQVHLHLNRSFHGGGLIVLLKLIACIVCKLRL